MRLLILISFLSLFFSCQNNTVYSNYYTFRDNIWYADSSIVFNFKNKTQENLKFNLSLSYNNDYPFQNFYTSYSLLDSNKNIINSRMVEYQLFEKKYGYPLGSGTFQYFVKDSVILEANNMLINSEYTFLVKHSMRKNELNGINKIGLTITN
tara:strand:+ start:3610 stop:4065 length:456 start_codon:yes stop_codon:yes gene_type:complete